MSRYPIAAEYLKRKMARYDRTGEWDMGYNPNRMARYDRLQVGNHDHFEKYNNKEEIDYFMNEWEWDNDKPKTQKVTVSYEHRWKNERDDSKIYYRIIGSPDVYAVQDKITGKIEKNPDHELFNDRYAVDNPDDKEYKYASIDLREMDLRGKFD